MVNTQSVVQPLKCLCNGALSWQVFRILGSHFSVACSVVSLGMATKLDRMISLILVATFINGIHSGVMEFCGYDFGGIHHGQLEMGMLLNSKVNTGFLPYSFIWAFVWTSFFYVIVVHLCFTAANWSALTFKKSADVINVKQHHVASIIKLG